MKSPELTVAVPAQAGVVISTGNQDDAVERALATAIADPGQIGDLLDALRLGRLWLPLPDDGPVTDGSAVYLPTVRYLRQPFIPAFTSAARLLRAAEELTPGERVCVVPHAVVRAADLARLLPGTLGIALNPGASESVPIYPAGVAELAADRATVAGRKVSVGPLPVTPDALLAGIRAGLTTSRVVREATVAWLSVERAGQGMIVSVMLDDPGDPAARETVLAAVQCAVTDTDTDWPVDVTFPGEGEPDVIDGWIAAHAKPFYQRAVGLPAPRPATA